MSVSFEDPVSESVVKKLKDLFGEPVVEDSKTFLLDNIKELRQDRMKALANEAKQPVTVALHSVGEIKSLSDGTKYQVTPKGWQKV